MDTYIAYGKKIAETLCSFGNHELYGGRQAGSSAEHRAAAFLEKEMSGIGLQEVHKEAFSCDMWEFRDAVLEIMEPAASGIVLRPYAYAAGGTGPEGIEAPLVYAGRGTEADYRGLDAEGKIVIIDIDMDKDWWIDAPTIEAVHHGALAVINSCTGGYAQLSEDAMNCQDFCGPVAIPSVNISRREAERLKTLCRGREPLIRLIIDNEVRPGGTSYNISGIIPGRSGEELIIIGDHYDSHFFGFQDNAAAAGLTLAIAKAVVEGDYQPERTLVFILHGAEEWGAVDTRYDWAIGAWNQVNRLHPEWAGRAICYINFELPAYQADTSWYLASSAELYTFGSGFLEGVDPPRGCYPEGIRRDWWSITPWSDEWSYSCAGIPAFLNGFMLKADGSFADFIHTIYHSQYDTPETWDEKVFSFNFTVFNKLLRHLDHTPAVPLDFSIRAKQLKESINEDVFKTVGMEVASFRTALERFQDASRQAWEKVDAINLGRQSVEKARGVNRSLLQAYRMFQDAFVRLNWNEEPVFPHEPLQKNILLLCEALDALTAGDTARGAEACAAVDLNYLAGSFSREVYLRSMDQTRDPAAGKRQFWGTGRIVSAVDLYGEIRLLQEGKNIGAVFAMLELKLEELQEKFRAVVTKEIRNLEVITAVLLKN